MPEEPNPDLKFSQADLDRIVQERLAKERAKYADYDDLKAKAEKADADEAAKGSEIDQLTRRVAELTTTVEGQAQKITDAETKALRAEVAVAKGLTPGQAKRLVGGTREEMEEDADDILANFGGTPSGKGDGGDENAEGAAGAAPPSRTPTAALGGGNNPTTTVEETDPAKLAASVPRQ